MSWKFTDESLLKIDGEAWNNNKTVTTVPNFLIVQHYFDEP